VWFRDTDIATEEKANNPIPEWLKFRGGLPIFNRGDRRKVHLLETLLPRLNQTAGPKPPI